MKSSRIIIIVVIIVAIAGGAVLVLKNNKKSTVTTMGMPPSTSSSTSNNTSNSTSTTTSTTAADSVTIQSFAFSPASITVKVGTKVTWTNKDSVGHTVTADSPSSDAPSSQTISQNGSYSFTFNKAGTYTYHCTPHPYMHGTVVVTQ